MVYDWEGKEAECYRMYVEEKRSLDEVMDFWKQRSFTPRHVVGFAPTVLYGRRLKRETRVLTANSKRAFQTQFKVRHHQQGPRGQRVLTETAAMGFPQQAESRSQEPCARRACQRTLGEKHKPEGHVADSKR